MNETPDNMGRRQFLSLAGKTLAGAAAISAGASLAYEPQAQAEPDDLARYDFILARVKFTEQGLRGRGRGPDVWNVRPGGDANLLDELSSVIRCRVKPIRGAHDWQPQYAREGQLNAVVTLDDLDTIRRYPFLFMTGENNYRLGENHKYNLKEYVTQGGFLLMDDCVVGSGGDFFYQSSYKVLEEVFGPGSVRLVPREHEVFHNVFDLGQTGLPSMEYKRNVRPGALPYMHGQNHGARAVSIGDRLAVFLSSTDIHCGWCDRHGFEWGRASYEKAIQMGINIITYALSH